LAKERLRSLSSAPPARYSSNVQAADSANLKLTVVIPSYNGRDLLAECLPALQRAVDQAGFTDRTEIIVVDDASSDDTVDWLGAEWPDVQVLTNSTNRGFAVTANRGLTAAKGDWIALLNNDVVVEPDWLSAAMRHWESPRVAAVASRIMSAQRPGVIEEAGDEYTSVGIPYKAGLYGGADSIESPRVCFAACGASAFLRREALEQVGFLHEALHAYYEDIELGFRLNLAGWDCVYEGRSVCHHLGSASYGYGSFRQKFNAARNAEIVFYTCMPTWLMIRHLPGHVLAMTMQTVFHAAKGSAGAYIRGKLAAIGLMRSIRRRRRDVQRSRQISNRELKAKLKRRWIRLLVLPNLRRMGKRPR
jgi:GT2 family glycosyltransferase